MRSGISYLRQRVKNRFKNNQIENTTFVHLHFSLISLEWTHEDVEWKHNQISRNDEFYTLRDISRNQPTFNKTIVAHSMNS